MFVQLRTSGFRGSVQVVHEVKESDVSFRTAVMH